MKKFILKISILLLLAVSWMTPSTGAEFFDTESSTQNTFLAGCWVAPSIPVLSYPANNTYAGITSAWNINPYMDWNNSTSPCPQAGTITYQYESYRDVGLTQLAYRSGWLTNSTIPAPGTPEGKYYWRVKAKDSQGYESDFSLPWLLVVDRTPPTVPGQIGWTNENPPVGSDYLAGTDFNKYTTCDGFLNYSPMSNLWGPSTDTNSVVYEREVYSPIDNRIYSNNNLSNNYENGGGAVNGTTYWVQVRAKDEALNYSNWTIKCSVTYDISAPIITDVVDLLATPEEENDTKAIISWNTDENSDSNLYWSDDNANWNLVSDSIFVTGHNLEILGLSTDMTYFYYVTSSDLAGNTSTSSTYSFSTGGMDPEDFTPTTDIVINEFLPNPTGDDFAPYPGGEWVELYNRGTVVQDMTGWSIGAYNTPSNRLPLNFDVNTFSSDGLNDKWLSPGEFMVVYRNGDPTFYMKNAAADRIRLFNASGTRVDRYMYTGSQVIENKSIARYPDGSDTWFDPIPSPLGTNILENWQLNQPEINYTFDGQKLSFEVTNVENFRKVEYQLTYNSDSGEQGVLGESKLNNQTSYKKGEIIFGTCSSGGNCVYHTNLNSILLKIILTNDSEIIDFEKIIN